MGPKQPTKEELYDLFQYDPRRDDSTLSDRPTPINPSTLREAAAAFEAHARWMSHRTGEDPLRETQRLARLVLEMRLPWHNARLQRSTPEKQAHRACSFARGGGRNHDFGRSLRQGAIALVRLAERYENR